LVRRPASQIRRLLESAALFATALIFLHTWFIEGIPVSCMVNGGSMAPTLLGSHVDLMCPKCRFPFACDVHGLNDPNTWGGGNLFVCPNCGTSYTHDSPPRSLSGDRVLIDRSAFQFRRPRRWEVVAFDRSEEGEGLVVKRVVGLPGEKIQIVNGRIFIDGKLLRKDLRQQRTMRILVHDDDYSSAESRWRPQDFGSNWTRNEGHSVHTESPNDEIGWLVYNHVNGASKFVTDESYYNRGRMQSRDEEIHPTPDVAMSFRLQDLHGHGMIWLQATDGRDEFMVQIDPRKKTFKVLKNRQPLPNGEGDLPGPLRGETFEVSLIDRQFLLAIGSKTIFTAAIDTVPIEKGSEPPLSALPLAIGVQGLGVAIDRLRVYRAIYYGEPPGMGSNPPPAYTIGPDEYFVLGDNSPISEDSRTWTENRMVRHNSLLGKPFVVIYPACGLTLGRLYIQVPDLSRIRYIR
jgi:signal peptidase I